MALRTINLGSVANDGTGDDLREAFEKVIFNFADLDARTPEATTAINLGNGQGIFANKNNAELQFKSLVAGQNVSLSSDGNTITVNVNAGVTQFVVEGDSGSFSVSENGTIKIEGGNLITTERIPGQNTILINSSALEKVQDDLNPVLGGNLNADNKNISGINQLTANSILTGIITGSLNGSVYGIDVRDLNYYRLPENSWNFGVISSSSVDNLWDYFWKTLDVDFGGIVDVRPNINLDFGDSLNP